MRVIVCADDGDQIAIDADDVATEQAVIRLELQNPTYNETSDFECVTLTINRARELAGALLTISEAIERYHSQPWGQQVPRLLIMESQPRLGPLPTRR
jgi:hypothetical protein